MGTTTEERPLPPDPGLPGAGGLLGSEGRAAVGHFLEERGWSTGELRAVQAMYTPGRSLIVRFRVLATRSDGTQRVMYISTERRARPRRFSAPVAAFEERFGIPEPVERQSDLTVWAYPYDPALPGLPDAAWGPAVRGSIRERCAAVSVRALRYRPRSRGVFRYRVLDPVTGVRRDLFGKTLRRRRLERVRRIRPALEGAAPVGEVGGHTVLFDPTPGRSLRDLLLEGGRLPRPDRIPRLLSDLRHGIDEDVSLDVLGVAGQASALIEHIVPGARREVAEVVEAVTDGAGETMQLQPVHGDLYEAQVFVGPRDSLSLIDFDDAGLGDPAMEAANFCSHLIALALAVPSAQGRLLAYRSLVRAAFLENLGIPDRSLAWREALVMLRLASGPFRVLHPRWPQEVRRRVRAAVRLLADL